MSNDTTSAPADKTVTKHAGERTTGGQLTRLVPQNFTELEHIAKILANSDIVTKELRGKAANVLLVLMFGNEIGLTPAQALQNVMVVNGRPSLWGDAVMGLVESSGQMESWKDWTDDKAGGTHYFQTKRKGRDPVIRSFSQQDAVKAKLDKKEGPWQEYTARMRFHRARSWALRDVYPDILKGIRYFEEERDVVELEKQSDKTYAMPKETPASAAVPVNDQKVIETTTVPSEPAPQSEKKADGEVVEFQVSGAATTDFDGNPDCFVIRDRADPPAKYYCDKEAYFTLAKSARDSGAKLAGIYTERAIGKSKARWLLALTAKG